VKWGWIRRNPAEAGADVAETSHHWAAGHRPGDRSAFRSDISRAMALIQLHLSMSSDDRVHLHRDDPHHALEIVAALFARRPERAAEIGSEPTEHGAWVDWRALATARRGVRSSDRRRTGS
jgi:hypothetical protein